MEYNPGPSPPLQLVSLNVTSLPAHLDAVMAISATAILLQETRLGEIAQRSLRSQLVAQGWSPFYGKPQPLVAGLRRPSAWNAVPGGVAILVRNGVLHNWCRRGVTLPNSCGSSAAGAT